MLDNPTFITSPLDGYDGLVLTIAHPLSAGNIFLKNACQIVVSELDQYDLGKTGPLPTRKVFYAETHGSQIEIAEICQHSILLDNHMNQNTLEGILSSEPEFLTALQTKAYEFGAKRFFSWCYKESAVAEIFINAGFRLCGEFPDLLENLVVQRFYKDLEYIPIDSKKQINITISENDIYETAEELLNPYRSDVVNNQDSFGIFIHDIKDQNIKAGLFGTIYKAENKGTPHGNIIFFWVDTTLRSKGLGTVLMMKTEDFCRQHSSKYVQAATNGFEAPGFYEKMGFEVVESCPGFYLLKDGPYSIFDCTKKLSTS